MALHFKDDELEKMVRRLASERGLSLTEAVSLAVRRELDLIPRPNFATAIEHIQSALTELKADIPEAGYRSASLDERIRPLQERVAEKKGAKDISYITSKQFFDDLHDEPHGDFSRTDVNDARQE